MVGGTVGDMARVRRDGGDEGRALVLAEVDRRADGEDERLLVHRSHERDVVRDAGIQPDLLAVGVPAGRPAGI